MGDVARTKASALALFMVFGLVACAATAPTQGAAAVELVSDRPGSNCKALGEAIGSQGNWATGDWTSNKNLMLGARNDLRNQAAALGGNVVHVQNQSNATAWGSLGTTNTTVVGMVYRCP